MGFAHKCRLLETHAGATRLPRSTAPAGRLVCGDRGDGGVHYLGDAGGIAVPAVRDAGDDEIVGRVDDEIRAAGAGVAKRSRGDKVARPERGRGEYQPGPKWRGPGGVSGAAGKRLVRSRSMALTLGGLNTCAPAGPAARPAARKRFPNRVRSRVVEKLPPASVPSPSSPRTMSSPLGRVHSTLRGECSVAGW